MDPRSTSSSYEPIQCSELQIKQYLSPRVIGSISGMIYHRMTVGLNIFTQTSSINFPACIHIPLWLYQDFKSPVPSIATLNISSEFRSTGVKLNVVKKD